MSFFGGLSLGQIAAPDLAESNGVAIASLRDSAGIAMNTELEEIAKRVNWYTDPDRTLAHIGLFLAQIMARGTADDIVAVHRHFSQEDFRKAYLDAPPGLFSRRAWAYWGLMLLDDPDRPMPERFPGANQFDWRKRT